MDVIGGNATTTMQHYRVGLAKTTEKRIWRYGKMSKFQSIIDMKKFREAGVLGEAASIPLESSFIHLYRDIEVEKGASLDIPVLSPIGGQGGRGDKPSEMTGQRRELFNKTVRIHPKWQTVINRTSRMDEQLLKPQIAIPFFEKAASDLKDWFTRSNDFDPFFAALMGYSPHLTTLPYGMDAETGYSANCTPKSHPNSFVQGVNSGLDFGTTSGAHTAYSFDAGWETNLSTALATLTDTAARHFNVQSIRNIKALARKLKIPPIMKKNGAYADIVWVTSAHIKQLQEDSEWLQIMQTAAERGQNNPLFTGLVEAYMIEGVLLIIDDTMPAARVSGDTDTAVFGQAYNSSYGTVNYGNTNYLDNELDISPRKPAILLGPGAISAATVGGFKQDDKTFDHGRILESFGQLILGHERADIMDPDANKRVAGYQLENTSSLSYWTWTPTNITI